MRDLPSLTALAAFEAAARHRSFKRAARELGVTPTAVSHQVRLLEEAVGQRLLRRRPRPVELTEAGARHIGVDLFYLDKYRQMGEEFLKSCEGMDWNSLMAHLEAVVEPFVKRYVEIAETAPAEYKELADSMVVHEESFRTFARLELSGDTERSLDDVIKQLKFPLK